MNMKYIVDIIGTIGGIFVGISLIPQLYSVCKNKDKIKSISIYFILCILFASLTQLIYSIFYLIIPMIIANISVFLNSLILLYLFVKDYLSR